MGLLDETAAAWGLTLDQGQLDQFAAYGDELRRWNERVNLTAITDPHEIVARHFLDSLRCALSWGVAPNTLIDIGTGAGFPGLPLKLLRPELRLTLVESIEKKAAFLRYMVDELALTDVEVLTARAEVVAHDMARRERFDVVTARAVAELRVLAEYCLPLCCIGGRFLAPKGPQIEREIEAARPAIAKLGGSNAVIEDVDVPGVERRTLIVIEKIAPTPPHYPRGAGVPAKRPL